MSPESNEGMRLWPWYSRDVDDRQLFSVLKDLSQTGEKIVHQLAQLVSIQQQRLAIELTMTADTVKQLVDAITALIQADTNDKAALATAQSDLAAITASDAALNDPALQASVDAALAAAAAASPTPPPVNPA